jgi:F0F1-type ATP synthase membrane subunit b/b'
MTSPELIILGVVVGLIIILFLFTLRLFFMVKNIDHSFAKLGFIVREDAKKYFDDAALKIVDTNKELQTMYQEAVETGTKRVLNDSGSIMEKTIADAQANAGQIIVRAQTDAQNILSEAQKQANNEYDLALQRAVDTINWTMQQYLHEEFDARKHEDLIKRIITSYSNEHRK